MTGSGAAAKAGLLMVMFMNGTAGIVSRYANLPPSAIIALKTTIGTLFLILIMIAIRKNLNAEAAKRNWFPLLTAGVFLAGDWLLLYAAYDVASVSIATVCEYMMPIFLIIASVVMFGEKLSLSKIVCISVSVTGLILASGILYGDTDPSQILGAALGLMAGLCYAGNTVTNRKITEIGAIEKTTIQMGVAAVLSTVLMFATEDVGSFVFDTTTIAVILVMGILLTAVSHLLYVIVVHMVDIQITAICAYIEPITALVLAAVVLGESMDAPGIVGAVMILGSAFVYELINRKDKTNDEVQAPRNTTDTE